MLANPAKFGEVVSRIGSQFTVDSGLTHEAIVSLGMESTSAFSNVRSLGMPNLGTDRAGTQSIVRVDWSHGRAQEGAPNRHRGCLLHQVRRLTRMTGVPRPTPLVSALGCAVRVDASGLSEADADEVGRVWADAASAPHDPLPARHLTVPVARNVTLPRALTLLSQAVTLAAIEARRGELWMLHAAGLADEHGRVIALVGPSGQGKTTAARTLATIYGYVSDETVGITADGTVTPYRKPLSVIEGSSRWDKTQRTPGELGLGTLPDAPLRLAAIVLLDRRADGPDEAVVEHCDLGEAFVELIAQTSYLADLPDPLRTIAAHLAATGGLRRVIYREADSLATALAPLFREPAERRCLDPIVRPRPEKDVSRDGVYRGAYLDALLLEEPDRVALLQPCLPEGATFRLVTGIGPALWRAAEGVHHDRLVSAAVETYGAPDCIDIGAAVDAAVLDLMEQSVLTTEPTWRVRTDAAVTGEGERYVALALSSLEPPTPIALEGSAAVIWGELMAARGTTASRLVDAVAERVGVAADQIAADVLAFLSHVEAMALVERVSP